MSAKIVSGLMKKIAVKLLSKLTITADQSICGLLQRNKIQKWPQFSRYSLFKILSSNNTNTSGNTTTKPNTTISTVSKEITNSGIKTNKINTVITFATKKDDDWKKNVVIIDIDVREMLKDPEFADNFDSRYLRRELYRQTQEEKEEQINLKKKEDDQIVDKKNNDEKQK